MFYKHTIFQQLLPIVQNQVIGSCLAMLCHVMMEPGIKILVDKKKNEIL